MRVNRNVCVVTLGVLFFSPCLYFAGGFGESQAKAEDPSSAKVLKVISGTPELATKGDLGDPAEEEFLTINKSDRLEPPPVAEQKPSQSPVRYQFNPFADWRVIV